MIAKTIVCKIGALWSVTVLVLEVETARVKAKANFVVVNFIYFFFLDLKNVIAKRNIFSRNKNIRSLIAL